MSFTSRNYKISRYWIINFFKKKLLILILILIERERKIKILVRLKIFKNNFYSLQFFTLIKITLFFIIIFYFSGPTFPFRALGLCLNGLIDPPVIEY